jgi:hypothetical protein
MQLSVTLLAQNCDHNIDDRRKIYCSFFSDVVETGEFSTGTISGLKNLNQRTVANKLIPNVRKKKILQPNTPGHAMRRNDDIN